MLSARHHVCGGRPLCGIVPISLLEKIASNHDDAEARQAAERTIAHTRAFQANRLSIGTPGHDLTVGWGAHHGPQHSIIPPNILQGIIDSDDTSEEQKRRARSNLQLSQAIRAARATGGAAGGAPPSDLFRIMYDAEKHSFLPGDQVRREGQATVQDVNINQVWDVFGKTYEFYLKFFSRNSIDGHGKKLIASLHYDDDNRPPGFNNAFFDPLSQQMVFGDGDGLVFSSFTQAIDVIAHELTHGVTDHTAKLPYHLQSGALNESISDVFGSMVKQFVLGQDAASADWLIGKGMFVPGIHATALRSMKAPGEAFNDRRLGGKDDQPAHMDKFVVLPDDDIEGSGHDNGGVHTNSGIPNHAFYLVATALEGNSWDRAGQIWYKTLTDSRLKDFAGNRRNWNKCFKFFADLTAELALEMYDADVQAVVKNAWHKVGL